MRNKDTKEIIKTKTRKVYKSNKLNKASFNDYNLNDYRVYLNAIALIGGVTEDGKYIQSNEPIREYTLSAVEFANQFNMSPKNAYKILKDAVDKLMKTDIKIEQPDLHETWRINVCEMAKYNEKEGSITVEFTQRIMQYLTQRTKNFTLYNLKEVADLTSLYAVRLYELIQQFNTTTGMLIFTIEQWRELFGLSNNQYPLYANLKQKVFTQALDEINTKTGYTLVMTEEKEGRKVARVRFDFEPDRIIEGINKSTGKLVTRHIKQKAKKTEINLDQQELDI